jgi:hypothetical protein
MNLPFGVKMNNNCYVCAKCTRSCYVVFNSYELTDSWICNMCLNTEISHRIKQRTALDNKPNEIYIGRFVDLS